MISENLTKWGHKMEANCGIQDTTFSLGRGGGFHKHTKSGAHLEEDRSMKMVGEISVFGGGMGDRGVCTYFSDPIPLKRVR